MAGGPCEKTRVRLDRPHLRFTGRLRERLCGGGARRCVNDELGDHRIIIGRYVLSFLDPDVDADPRRQAMALDRKSVVEGKNGYVSVDLGVRRRIKQK